MLPVYRDDFASCCYRDVCYLILCLCVLGRTSSYMFLEIAGMLVLFLIFEGKLPFFHHWGWWKLWRKTAWKDSFRHTRIPVYKTLKAKGGRGGECLRSQLSCKISAVQAVWHHIMISFVIILYVPAKQVSNSQSCDSLTSFRKRVKAIVVTFYYLPRAKCDALRIPVLNWPSGCHQFVRLLGAPCWSHSLGL